MGESGQAGGYAGLTMQAAGALGSAYSAREAGRHAKWQGDFNAKLAEMQAEDALKRGEIDAAERSKQTGQLQGAQKAALAAQGLDPNEVGGTAEDILTSTQAIGERDVQTIKANALRQAWGFRLDATNSRLQGRFAKIESDQRATGTLINGATSIYRDGYNAGYWGGNSKGLTVPTQPKASNYASAEVPAEARTR